MSIPAIGFSAFSGTGKTTLLEKVIAVLVRRGLRVGVVKHDAHGFEMDREGKDSRRFTLAGAETIVLTGPGQTAVLAQGGETLDMCLQRVRGADLILVEGFKRAPIPRIGLSRAAAGTDFPDPPESYIAVVTDREDIPADTVRFGFEDAEALADFIIRYVKEARPMPETDFTHFNDEGRARMVDVGSKAPTQRTAVAAARVLLNRATFDLIRSGGVKKGDVLTVAQIAGIMAAKRTPDLIPMCHPILLDGIDLKLRLDEDRLSVEIEATVRCSGRTGVEMEALTAASGAALTVYDMCKAVQRDMVITDIRLVEKTGGVHGDYHREEG